MSIEMKPETERLTTSDFYLLDRLPEALRQKGVAEMSARRSGSTGSFTSAIPGFGNRRLPNPPVSACLKQYSASFTGA